MRRRPFDEATRQCGAHGPATQHGSTAAQQPGGTGVDPYTAVSPGTARELRARYPVVRGVAVAGAHVSLLERGPEAAADAAAVCPQGAEVPFHRWLFGGDCGPGSRAAAS